MLALSATILEIITFEMFQHMTLTCRMIPDNTSESIRAYIIAGALIKHRLTAVAEKFAAKVTCRLAMRYLTIYHD